ncbi:MAG: hypothetical protein Q7W55_06690 [Pseudohongiella sp.]|nr:hypothetical protein [Pseudohongiella sp.]
MKNLQQFLRRSRIVLGLVATLVFFLTVLLPPALGMLTRQAIVDRVSEWQGTSLAEFNIESINTGTIRAGWFRSEIHISANGTFLSADGRTSATRRGILHINHGPVIWHLSDTLMALADIQLLPLVSSADTARHFSGSAIVQLTSGLRLQLRAIAGIHASGGEHWLELQQSSPLLSIAGARSGRLWLDMDIKALTNAGMSQQVERWRLNESARTSNNRLLFSTALQ